MYPFRQNNSVNSMQGQLQENDDDLVQIIEATDKNSGKKIAELEKQVANQLQVIKQFEKVTNLVTLRLAELINDLIKQGRYCDNL